MKFIASQIKQRSSQSVWLAPGVAATLTRPSTTLSHRMGEGRGEGAFTLAEVLAALMFLAIVIPVAVQGLEIANHAGEVATRKGDAARIAEQVLNENLVTTNWNTGLQNGTIAENGQSYNWTLRSEAWTGDPALSGMQQLSVDVNYTVQTKVYSVSLSTLVNNGTP